MEATREKILEVAGEVFADKGYEQATVREICARAGANVAAVNYHFGDKQTLYLEAVKHAHCFRAEQPEVDWPPGTPAAQRLYDFVLHMLRDMLDEARPDWQTHLLLREMSSPTSACEQLVRSFIGPKFELLLGIVNDLLPASASRDDRHLYAFSVVGQCLLYRFHRPVGRLLVGEEGFRRLSQVERLAAHITSFSLAALQAAGDTLAKDPT